MKCAVLPVLINDLPAGTADTHLGNGKYRLGQQLGKGKQEKPEEIKQKQNHFSNNNDICPLLFPKIFFALPYGK